MRDGNSLTHKPLNNAWISSKYTTLVEMTFCVPVYAEMAVHCFTSSGNTFHIACQLYISERLNKSMLGAVIKKCIISRLTPWDFFHSAYVNYW